MLLGGLLSWWYGLGWAKLMHSVLGRVHGVLGFFSVWQLLGSLFAPFRQISAGRVQGSISAKFAAFGDRLLSRFIGAFVRLLLVITGLFVALLVGLFGLLLVITWPFVPVLPLVGIYLMQRGVSL